MDTHEEESAPQPTRRIRPWLAGLLTFLGWGVGLYYARKTRAAIRLAIGQVFVTALAGAILVAVLASNSPMKFPFVNPNGFSAFDVLGFGLSVFVAVGVWRFAAKQDALVQKASPARLWGYLGIWLLPILGAALLALLVRMFLLQPFNVPSGAMSPTLQVGDFFAVNKRSFGYSRASLVYPLTRMSVNGRIFGDAPERGDVVVFKNQKDGNKDYVKRVIGLPGDTVQMIRGHLHINGQPVEKELVEIGKAVCGAGTDGPIYRETLDSGASYIVQECAGDQGPLDNIGPYQVPPGHYFMMGDNRDQSQDSRVVSAVGYISHDNLVGKALVKKNTSN